MATTLTLIRFTQKSGKPVKEYGLAETQEDEGDHILAGLYDNRAEEIEMYGKHEWVHIDTLGECDDDDDFWHLVAECKQIKWNAGGRYDDQSG